MSYTTPNMVDLSRFRQNQVRRIIRPVLIGSGQASTNIDRLHLKYLIKRNWNRLSPEVMLDDPRVSATVDADTCITCFYCQEVCPEKAITLR